MTELLNGHNEVNPFRLWRISRLGYTPRPPELISPITVFPGNSRLGRKFFLRENKSPVLRFI